MVLVDIEYCVPCGLLDPAVQTQHKLLKEFGGELDGVRLTTGHNGVFKVFVDDELVFDKDENGNEIDLNVITAEVQNRIPPGA